MQTAETRLLRRHEVEHLTGIGRSSLYAMARSGRFPQPVKISERCSAWNEVEVRAWIAARIEAAKTARAAA